MKYIFYTLFLCAFISIRILCAQENTSDSASLNRASPSTAGNIGAVVGSNYILKPSDVIEIEVFQERDLEKTVRIEGDGTVALALIGKVKVGGLTVSAAKSKITELYNKDYLVDPQISVLVMSFSPKMVRVLGSVNSPGVVEIPHDRDLTLTEAIAEARGLTRLGNPRALKIKRVEGDGQSQQIEANLSKIITDPDEDDIILKEGDTIWIPERMI